MSIDRSLKNKNSLIRHRNVLTRSERLAVLEEEREGIICGLGILPVTREVGQSIED